MGTFFFANISEIEIMLLLALLLIVVILLLIVLLRNSDKMNRLTYPVYDYIVKGAEHKANEITYDAMKSSRKMLVDAELAGTKIIAKEKIESRKIEKNYEEQLHSLTDETKQILGRYAKETEGRFRELTESLEQSVSAGIAKNEQHLQGELKRLSEGLDASFHSLEDGVTKHIKKNIEEEFDSTKRMIDQYRASRMDLIDNNLVSLIEQTTLIALRKKLNASDHAELLYQALEEAKAHGVFK